MRPVTESRASLTRRLSVVLLVVGVLAACSPPSNDPESYTEPLVSTTLEQNGTTTSTEVSQAAANFLGGCLRNGASIPECECIFAFFAAQVPFDDFKELDSQLSDDPESVPDNVKAGIEACRGGGTPTSTAAPEGTGTTAGTAATETTTGTSVPQ